MYGWMTYCFMALYTLFQSANQKGPRHAHRLLKVFGASSRFFSPFLQTAITNNFSDFLVASLDNIAFHNGLTNCILVDSSTVIYWTSPFVLLGVSGLFC